MLEFAPLGNLWFTYKPLTNLPMESLRSIFTSVPDVLCGDYMMQKVTDGAMQMADLLERVNPDAVL